MNDAQREPCKRPDGLTKLGYYSHAKAKRAARIIQMRTTDRSRPIKPYKCNVCGLYHVGHTDPGRDRRPNVDLC